MDDLDDSARLRRTRAQSRLERPRLDDDPDPIAAVGLSVDDGAELPLWGANWWQLGPSTDLLDDLAAWQEQFDASFHFQTGRMSSDVAADWAHRGDELATELRRQLGPTIQLDVDLWPVAQPRPRPWFERWRR